MKSEVVTVPSPAFLELLAHYGRTTADTHGALWWVQTVNDVLCFLTRDDAEELLHGVEHIEDAGFMAFYAGNRRSLQQLKEALRSL